MLDSAGGMEMITRPPIPGWTTFERNYKKVKGLDEEQRTGFVKHDISNATTTLISAYKWYFDRKPEYKEVDASASKHLSAQETVALIEKALSHTYDNALTNQDAAMGPYFQKFFDERLPHLRAFFPILKASTLFLDAPTEAKFQDLVSRQIDLATLVSLTTGKTQETSHAMLNGVEAVIAFNLLNNAEKHGTRDSLFIDAGERNSKVIMLSNNSAYPMPTDPFSLGNRGTNSTGIGAGLFIAKHLYAPLAQVRVKNYDNGVDIESVTEPVKASPVDPPHKIQFFITRKPDTSPAPPYPLK